MTPEPLAIPQLTLTTEDATFSTTSAVASESDFKTSKDTVLLIIFHLPELNVSGVFVD
jgi:hypothetical protein